MNFNMIASSGSAGGSWYIWIILIVVFVGMILMTVIPQRKQKKKMQEMMSSMAVGDKIMTIGGFIGTIVEINSDFDDQRRQRGSSRKRRYRQKRSQNKTIIAYLIHFIFLKSRPQGTTFLYFKI